jgi:DNA polymerase elongation subunit (family B)
MGGEERVRETMNDRWVWEDSTWVRTDDFLPEVVIFARNYDDPFVTKKFTFSDFRPYFYVPAEASFHPREVTQVDGSIILDAKGRNIRKVFVRLPSDVVQARKAYDWTDEADIPFDFRFMLDHNITYAFTFDEMGKIIPTDVPLALPPRICFLDMEVRSPPIEFPKQNEVKFPIVMIQCGDSYTGEIKLFTYQIPQVAPDQVACRTEPELMAEFMKYIQTLDPDVITGWNSNDFDLPYFINRGTAIHVKQQKLSRGSWKPRAEFRQGMPEDTPEQRKKRKGEWQVKCTGRQLVDMLVAFKKFWKAVGELDSYTLKAVVRNPDVMEEDVFAYEEQGSHIDKLITDQRWTELLEYGRNDVIALQRIDKKTKLFDFYENLRMMCGVKLEETMKNSKMIESLLFRDYIMKPMPTRRYDIKSDGYEGALVIEPRIGLHKSVGVFDLAALYPTIIIAFDLSPDIDHVVPRVIKTVLDERERLRALKKAGLADEATKKKETVLKFIANSFYGVFGWDKFRLFDIEIASFITRTGREINEYLQSLAAKFNLDTIYGDTDSIFVLGVKDSRHGLFLQDFFNLKLRDEWTPEHKALKSPQLKFEEWFRTLIFKPSSTDLEKSAKKRYAGHITWSEGHAVDELLYKGIEVRRSDQAAYTKEKLLEFLNLALIHDDPEAAIACIHDAYFAVREGRVSVLDISIPQGITSMEANSPRVRGVLYAQQVFDIPYAGGAKPRLIYLRGNHDSICLYDGINPDDVPLKVRVDWITMAEKIIFKKMESYVLALGVNLRHNLEGQQTLSTTWFE